MFLVGEGNASGRHAPGRRVGELDEEMVYETRVGDVFTLGTTSWRVEQITHDQVLVSPPGHSRTTAVLEGRCTRSAVGAGARVRHVRPRGRCAASGSCPSSTARSLDEFAANNLVSYLAEQQAPPGRCRPTRPWSSSGSATSSVTGEFVCTVPSVPRPQPLGAGVEHSARERYGMDVQATATNDGMVLRIPDTESEPPSAELIVCDPELIESVDQRRGLPRRPSSPPGSEKMQPARCCSPDVIRSPALRSGNSACARRSC